MQVCDKLKEIAIRTNDPDLLRRAEQLEERSQACYTQRTAHLRGLVGGFESDEKTLDQYLASGKSRAVRRRPSHREQRRPQQPGRHEGGPTMRTAIAFLLLAGCAGTGCMSMPGWGQKPKPAPAEVAAQPAQSRPPVSAEQVTDSNARQMASALFEELDRDAQAASPTSTEMAAGDAKADNSKPR